MFKSEAAIDLSKGDVGITMIVNVYWHTCPVALSVPYTLIIYVPGTLSWLTLIVPVVDATVMKGYVNSYIE